MGLPLPIVELCVLSRDDTQTHEHAVFHCFKIRSEFHDADLDLAQQLGHTGLPYWWYNTAQR